jgi:putative selenate reductase FAD-binding subunit
MILDYFRPKTVKEALALHESHPNSRFLGGGSSVQNATDEYYAIDLQLVGLNKTNKENNTYSIGATVTLDEIYEYFKNVPDLRQALRIEGSKNQRNRATLGGLLATADGRSPFLTCLTSMNSFIYMESADIPVDLNQFLMNRKRVKKLILNIKIDFPEKISFDSVARSPLDKPIVCCAVSKYGTESRVSIGGFGLYPILASGESFIEMDEKKVVDAFLLSDDQWASASYRASIIKTLAERLLN